MDRKVVMRYFQREMFLSKISLLGRGRQGGVQSSTNEYKMQEKWDKHGQWCSINIVKPILVLCNQLGDDITDNQELENMHICP
jgi:hypothetical protein